MATRMKKFKILVQNSKNCIDIAHYLNKSITSINKLGVYVQLEKIEAEDMDTDMVEALRKKSITYFPALITDEGAVIIGKDKIKALFEDGFKGARRGDRIGNANTGWNNSGLSDLEIFQHKELFKGKTETGWDKPRKDDDDDEENKAKSDIMSKMAHYDSNTPKHRQSADPINRDPQPTKRNAPAPEFMDNIHHTCYDCQRDPCQCNTSAEPDASLTTDADAKMLAAWMDKNATTDDY